MRRITRILLLVLLPMYMYSQEVTAVYENVNVFGGYDKPVVIAILEFEGVGGIGGRLYEELNKIGELKEEFEFNAHEFLWKNRQILKVSNLNAEEKRVREALREVLGVSLIVTVEGRSSEEFIMRIIETQNGREVYSCDYKRSKNSTGIKDAVRLFSENQRTEYKEKPKEKDCGEVYYSWMTYKTVKIGEQCWLKENLNVGTMIKGKQEASNNGKVEKYCYDDDPENCRKYGGLYRWDEAMEYRTSERTQGICPDGWHIPTLSEFTTLKAALNNEGNALKSTNEGTGSGSGTNTSGFSALLVGNRYYSGGFGGLGYTTYFWSSTELASDIAGSLYLTYRGSDFSLIKNLKETGFSVRCAKDQSIFLFD